MLVRNSLAVAAIAILGSACSSFGTSAEQQAAAGDAARYPNLSYAPSQGPEKDDVVTVMANYNSLMTEKAQLIAAMEKDIARAKAERSDEVTMMVNGRSETLSIEDAAARLEQEKQAVQAAAARQVAQPMPKLGGKPPKDQR